MSARWAGSHRALAATANAADMAAPAASGDPRGKGMEKRSSEGTDRTDLPAATATAIDPREYGKKKLAYEVAESHGLREATAATTAAASARVPGRPRRRGLDKKTKPWGAATSSSERSSSTSKRELGLACGGDGSDSRAELDEDS